MYKKTIIIVVIASITIILTGLLLWNALQENVFFHPWHDAEAYKALQSISEFKEVTIEKDKTKLSGWFWNMQGTESPSPLIIFFTGNAQNSSNTMYNYYHSDDIKEVFHGYNLLIVDYPGYGLSIGKPSDESMFAASDVVFEYAENLPYVQKDSIVIMGYSIGTGVATYCASQHDACALVLVAPYDTALSLYNDAINSFHGSTESLAKYKFNSLDYAKKVTEETLIFTSKDDEVINYTHSVNLSKEFVNLKDVVIFEGINHNGYFSNSDFLNQLKEFLERYLPDVC